MAFKYKQGAIEQTWDRVVIPFVYVISEAGAKTAKECEVEGDVDNINPAGMVTVMLDHPITGQRTSAILPIKNCKRVPREPTPVQEQNNAQTPTNPSPMLSAADFIN